MERIWSAELPDHIGERVSLAGWLHRLRHLSRVNFLILRDARGYAQVVLEGGSLPAEIEDLPAESVISVTGDAVASEQAPMGVEVRNPRVNVIARSAAAPPFDLFRPTLQAQLPTILDHAAVTLRHPRRGALWQIAAASMQGFRDSLRSMGFVEIQTPKIVGSATEGGANVFPVDYFGRPAFLAQSPQFYKQIMVGVFERVFEVGPVFRAEPHDTTRHLNEYVSLDAEMGFIEDHGSVMRVLAKCIEGMLAATREHAGEALRIVGASVPEPGAEIATIHFVDAQAVLREQTHEDVAGALDLSPAQERFLGEWARREYGSDLLFVTGYPMAKRPFYTHPDPRRSGFSNSFDLLFRGVEIVTGGQRLHRFEDYVDALARSSLSQQAFDGYLEAFRYGMPPHGGFAIGLERWVSQLVGAPNVRSVALFPRDLHRLTP